MERLTSPPSDTVELKLIRSGLAGERIDGDLVEALDGRDVGPEPEDLPLPDDARAVVHDVERVHYWECGGVD